jgi:hypothetical protein
LIWYLRAILKLPALRHAGDTARREEKAGMNLSDALKAAEEKMDDTLLAYTQRNRRDPELHQRLIDDLRTATTEFLEVRRRLIGLGRPTNPD